MRMLVRLFIIVAFLFVPFPIAAVERAADLTGHWDGAVTAGDETIPVSFDVVETAEGGLSGTFSGGPEGVSHLPLSAAALTGRSVRLVVPGGDAGDAVFTGTLANDGPAIAGEVAFAGQSYPYRLKRTGPARLPGDRTPSHANGI